MAAEVGATRRLGADSLFYLAIGAALLLLHFQIVDLSGYPITAGLGLSGVVVAAAVRGRPPALAFGLLATVVGALSLQALLTPGADVIAFLRTAVLFTYSVGLVLWVAYGTLAPRSSRARPYFVVMLAIDALAWLQYVSGRRGIETFFNPWRQFSYLHRYNPELGLVPVRAEAFYLEPSFAALVLVLCAAAAILAGGRPLIAVILCAGGMGAIRSASGIITVAVFALILVLVPQEVDTSTPRARRDRRGLLLVMAGLAIWLTPYAVSRLTSTSQQRTSANFRLDSPLTLLAQVLGNSVIGEPLGSSNQAVTTAGLIVGNQTGKSLDNGIYVYIFYFGWVGIILAGGALLYLLYRGLTDLEFGRLAAFAIPVVLMSAVFTGAVITPEYAVLVALVLMELRRRLVTGIPTRAVFPVEFPISEARPLARSPAPPPRPIAVLLSIITVTLNDLDGLRLTHASLGSLVGDARVEWVVWDGRSRDGTVDWLASGPAAPGPPNALPRWESAHDGGIYDAMNRATALANGTYLWYLNAGDEAVPGEVGRLLAILERPRAAAGVFYGDCLLALGGGRQVRRRARPVSYLRHSLPTSHQAMVFPRTAVLAAGGYDTSFRLTGDYDLACRLDRLGAPFERVGVCVVRFHMGGQSTQNRAQVSAEAARVQRVVRHATPVTVALSGARRRLVFAALGALEYQRQHPLRRGHGPPAGPA